MLNVLLQNYPELNIIWVTKFGYTDNLQWLKTQSPNNVSITHDENHAWNLKPQAAIIATASHSHYKYIKEAVSRKIPVLSEKPFCLSIDEAQELINLNKQMQVAIGVNFEFVYASYLKDLAASLNYPEILSIDITWEDPFSETRYGEKKIGDVYTPMMHDSLQHCWSMLKVLFPDATLNLICVSYNEEDSTVSINAKMGTKSVNFSLSRRASQRSRKISINGGRVVLDFAIEPGILTIDQKVIQNEWHGHSPLRAVFNSFFSVIKDPALQHKWPLNIHNCMEIVSLSVQATKLLEQVQMRCLKNRVPLIANDTATRNLLIDIFLPKICATGEQHPISDIEDQITFSNYIINKLDTTWKPLLIS